MSTHSISVCRSPYQNPWRKCLFSLSLLLESICILSKSICNKIQVLHHSISVFHSPGENLWHKCLEFLWAHIYWNHNILRFHSIYVCHSPYHNPWCTYPLSLVYIYHSHNMRSYHSISVFHSPAGQNLWHKCLGFLLAYIYWNHNMSTHSISVCRSPYQNPWRKCLFSLSLLLESICCPCTTEMK